MLTRRNNLSSQYEYYSNSLINNTTPTLSHSIFYNLAAGFAAPSLGVNEALDAQYALKPESLAIKSFVDYIGQENQNPLMGWGQKGASYLANMIGTVLNPITWMSSSAGGMIARGIISGAEKIAPNIVSTFMRRPFGQILSHPLTPAGITSSALKNYGVFFGGAVPLEINNQFNTDTGHINWGGVAKESSQMGAYGIAIGSIPFALGLLKGKVNRSIGEEYSSEITSSKIDQALKNNVITPEEYQWYTEYAEHLKDPSDLKKMQELQERATQIAIKNGHPGNIASHEVQFDILKEEDMKNLQAAASDQLISDVPENYKTALSDFVVHNRLDELRAKPADLDGVRGYVDFINEKLKFKNSKLEESNKILDEHLTKRMSRSMPLSQEELLRSIRKLGLNVKGMNQLGLTIPDRIKSRISLERRIEQVKDKIKNYKRLLKETGDKKYEIKIKERNQTISDLEKKLKEPLHPVEEIKSLREELITEKGLKEGWERSNQYHRLLDLSNMWNNAKTLVDRVHLERDYHRQESFKNLSEQLIQVSESNANRFARPEDVMTYVKTRLEEKIYKKEDIKNILEMESIQKEVPENADTLLNEQLEKIKELNSESLTDEFEKSSERFKEFKASESIFKNLISCVLGASNA